MRLAMMRMIAGGITVIAAVLLYEAVQAQTEQQCALCYGKTGAPLDLEPPEILISGCTAVIQSGTRSGGDLAVAFTNRGLGYRRTSQFERAFEDFSQAITLDSTYTPAYYHRGKMYLERGEIQRAEEDFDQVARLKRREAELAVEEL
jgi:tetratricopeptide (TPR) repeat protein